MMEGGVVDDQAAPVILTLERKSVQPFKTQDEYLYAMQEDLAEWFNTLYNINITVDNFFEQLETGVLICQHANQVQVFILQRLHEDQGKPAAPDHHLWSSQLQENSVQYRSSVKAGSFQCRDNISNFIAWCRGILLIPDVVLFETDDLVLRKNVWNVVLCLLEVARRGAKYGMLAPRLVQLEAEIDAEIAGERPAGEQGEQPAGEQGGQPTPEQPQVKRRTVDMMSLDQMVREILGRCSCPDQFPMIRVSEGKYKIGDSQTLIFIRILRYHVMVRIGGGWDTLENYLDRHDPCRCVSKGHKLSPRRGSQSVAATPYTSPYSQQAQLQVKRRGSTASGGLTGLEVKTVGTTQPAHDTVTTRPLDASSTSSKSSLVKSSQDLDGDGQESSAINSTKGGSKLRAPHPDSCSSINKQRASIGTLRQHKHFRSVSDLAADNLSLPSDNAEKEGVASTTKRRPSSAKMPERVQAIRTQAVDRPPAERGRSRERETNNKNEMARSRSLGSREISKKLSQTAPAAVRNIPQNSQLNTFMVSRTSSGQHKIDFTPSKGQSANPEVNKSDQLKRFTTTRVKITPDKILPSKPKTITRSQSADVPDGVTVSEPNESSANGTIPYKLSGHSEISPQLHRVRRASVSDPLALTNHYEDYPEPPPEDHELNQQMEQLFEEYKRIERGSPSMESMDQQDTQRESGKVYKCPSQAAHSLSKSRSASRESLTGPRSRPQTRNPTPSNRGRSRSKDNFLDGSVTRPPNPSIRNSSKANSISRENTLAGQPARPSVPSAQMTSKIKSRSKDNLLDDSRAKPVVPPKPRRVSSSGANCQFSQFSPSYTTPVKTSLQNSTQPARPSTPVSQTARPSTPVNQTARPSTPVNQVTRPSTPVNQTARPSAPVNQTARPSTPVNQTARPSAPEPGCKNNMDQSSRPRTINHASSSRRRTSSHNAEEPATRPRSPGPAIHPLASQARRPESPVSQLHARPSTPVPHRSSEQPEHLRPASAGSRRTPAATSAASPTPKRRSGLSTVTLAQADTTVSTKTNHRRSQSVGRISVGANNSKAGARVSSNSEEDLLDSGAGERRSRVDTGRKRDHLLQVDRSSPGTPQSAGTPCEITEQARSNSVTAFHRNSIPDELSPMFSVAPSDEVYDAYDRYRACSRGATSEGVKAKLRKDNREGPRTKIPFPVDMRGQMYEEPFSASLKRFDSGVEINNMSPTENSVHGDDDVCLPWSPNEAVSLTAHTLSFSIGADDEYY